MPHKKDPVFGIAMRNFTKYPEMPSAAELIDYGVRMEELGYESIWAWDHILLGRRAKLPDPRGADHSHGHRRAHLEDQGRNRHPGDAGAQSR